MKDGSNIVLVGEDVDKSSKAQATFTFIQKHAKAAAQMMTRPTVARVTPPKNETIWGMTST